MSVSKDIVYYTGRERRARAQAGKAVDISARLAHVAAADGYAERVADLRADQVPDRAEVLAAVAASIDERVKEARKRN